MAGERTQMNVRITSRDRADIVALVEKGVYPTVSAFVERAVQHLLDHEKGVIVEGTDAVRKEIFRGAADDLIEERLKVIISQWSQRHENESAG